MIDHVTHDVGDGIQTIRLDRIEAENALTAAMCESLANSVSFGEGSSQVRAILLTGGPGIFTTGIDPSWLQEFVNTGSISHSVIRLLKTIATVDKPIVAAVDGPVQGIGTTLLFLCDYVVASEWASFSSANVDSGLPPHAAASLLAPRIIGYQRTFALLVMGDQFDALQAREAGFVNRVVPPEEVETVGREAAMALAAKPPEAVRLTRTMLRGDRREVLTRIDQETASFPELLKSPAARDALQAYIDRRRGG